ncbi:hypothetical protein PZA11_005161 [Diplocarpon coronariae]|nr:hypothetical protein JHW43_004340 [Diplocarpon mali]
MDSSSVTPRHSQRSQNLSSCPATQETPSSRTSEPTTMTARQSPFLPSSLEMVLLSIYPATLVVGSLFALLDPAARASPYNATTQSHFANTAPSYFAKKSNVFNVFFVKQGWAWVTIGYLFFLFTHPSTGPSSLTLTQKRLRGIVRYSLVTTWWIFVTQWFFGPPIIDRGFTLTGGQCELVQEADAGNVGMDSARQFVTGVACKAVGGKWAGGHDISGHVFLLVLGSMFLFEEVFHVILKSRGAKEERTISMDDGAIKSAEVESQPEVAGPTAWTLGAKIVLGIGSLCMYMLLMTAAYFHTWFEKLTGLLVAWGGIFLVYFLPRAVPAMRSVVGMPGV